MRRLYPLIALAGLAAGGLALFLFFGQGGAKGPRYRLAKIERGPLTSTVSASGTLNAVITVQVGSQVSGQIKELSADFNSPVQKGQVIARIAPEIFEAKVHQAVAELEAARAAAVTQEANVERAQASMDNARAALAVAAAQTAKSRIALLEAKRNFDRRVQLARDGLIPASEREAAEAAHDSAAAQLEASRAQEVAQSSEVRATSAQRKVADAQLDDARARVKQREAALRQAQVDLENTIIRAPVDGVVVSRNVDVGQTVAASLQAPTLFTIAQDLTRMQVDTNVDEADISRIRQGQPATFTVDAFPAETFSGEVIQIRKAPQVVQNVVTYDVVVSARNADHRVYPGMTANVRLVVDHKESVLKLPNAALRFNPDGARPAAGPQAGPPAGGDGGRASPGEVRERLVKTLGLSGEQQAKLDQIFQETRQEFMKLRQENLTERTRQVRASEIRQASRAKIRAILTPAQREQYDRRESGGSSGRVWVAGRNGEPQPILLRIGATDGNFTEILGGDIQEGRQVIVGTARPADSRRQSRGLRFGF